MLRRVRLADPMKQKHLTRALESLAEEGVTQVFKPMIGANWVVGVVGQLQLDVLRARLPTNTASMSRLEPSPYETARWVFGDAAEIEKFLSVYRAQMATDRDGAAVFLAKSNWEVGYVADKFPKLTFAKTRERADVHGEG